MSKRNYEEMTVEDFIFIAFSTGASHIVKRLRDKRLTSKRYVADHRWMSEKHGDKFANDVTCWFHVNIGTKRSLPMETWVNDCEKTGLNWEIRQEDKTHYTVFLFTQKDWLHNKQVRTLEDQWKYAEKVWNGTDNEQ